MRLKLEEVKAFGGFADTKCFCIQTRGEFSFPPQFICISWDSSESKVEGAEAGNHLYN